MRRRLAWAAFALSIAAAFSTLGWATVSALRLEKEEADLRAAAALEDRARLALWRMDSALAPLLAELSARGIPPDRAPLSRPGASLSPEAAAGTHTATPLPAPGPLHVLLHFRAGSGEIASPEAPAGAGLNARVAEAERRLAELRARVSAEEIAAGLARAGREPPAPAFIGGKIDLAREESQEGQLFRNTLELQARQRAYQQVLEQRPQAPERSGAGGDPGTSVLKPLWLHGTLLLVRPAGAGPGAAIEGAWLDWPELRSWLLEMARELLPAAALEPLGPEPAPGARRLASLPMELHPGAVGEPPAREPSPIRLSLSAAWACLALAAAASGVLLLGAFILGGRRAAFASAVTHELRTPLTTFRLYTDLLAGGRLKEEEKRREYLETLQGEAERLGRLVENVLSYARLERGSRPPPVEAMELGRLLERARVRLAERAERAGRLLVLEVAEEARSVRVAAEPTVVEEILLNLVENSCRYARGAADPTIRIRADLAPGKRERRVLLGLLRRRAGVSVEVRDHGPGIARREARRLFRPFHRSSREAAGLSPGVGLGLALSRRLARSLGGDLRLGRHPGPGAVFVLSLPALPAARAPSPERPPPPFTPAEDREKGGRSPPDASRMTLGG